jgi:coenzyme F420 biosynthesis associated uncharacterized protein
MSPSTKSKLTIGRAVDWDFAAAVGAKLARPGPAATDYTHRQVIEQLAQAARSSELPVREVTGLTEGGEIQEARIIDRTEWIRAATRSMRVMTGGSQKPKGFISGRITGAQTGAVLAFISSGILGQYDPFGPGGGELLLVYPNVIAVERQLRVQPADFRLWVCLHEVTHRVQFRANPWLADHMSQSLAVLTEEAGEDVTEVVGRLAEFVRSRRDGVNGAAPEPNSTGMIGLLRAVQSEPQRKALDQLLVLGTLLEGHADHVMDAVGPAVVPSVATIRRRFTARRQGGGLADRMLRALLGIDAKLRQYAEGAAFTRHVVGAVGMEGFNTVWTSPETLPTRAEITDPAVWLRRVQ